MTVALHFCEQLVLSKKSILFQEIIWLIVRHMQVYSDEIMLKRSSHLTLCDCQSEYRWSSLTFDFTISGLLLWCSVFFICSNIWDLHYCTVHYAKSSSSSSCFCPPQLSEAHRMALSTISYIGCSISIFCLAITLVTFAVLSWVSHIVLWIYMIVMNYLFKNLNFSVTVWFI